MTNDRAVPAGVDIKVGFEVIFFVLLIAMGALLADTSSPDSISFMVIEYLDAGTYSRVVGILLIVTSLYQVALAIKKRNTIIHIPYISLAGLLATTAYVIGFMYIGFYVSTFFFLIIYSLLIEGNEERHVRSKIIFSIGTLVVLYGIFTWFKIYLPPAWLM